MVLDKTRNKERKKEKKKKHMKRLTSNSIQD